MSTDRFIPQIKYGTFIFLPGTFYYIGVFISPTLKNSGVGGLSSSVPSSANHAAGLELKSPRSDLNC